MDTKSLHKRYSKKEFVFCFLKKFQRQKTRERKKSDTKVVVVGIKAVVVRIKAIVTRIKAVVVRIKAIVTRIYSVITKLRGINVNLRRAFLYGYEGPSFMFLEVVKDKPLMLKTNPQC